MQDGRVTNDCGRETRNRLAGFGGSARIYHASTNLASTSSILGHLGSAWQLQYRLARREFEVAAERGGSWHANPSLKLLGSALPRPCPTWPREEEEEEEEEHVPPVATDHSLEPWICLNLDNVGPRIGLISISA